jgi:hypothetical protein
MSVINIIFIAGPAHSGTSMLEHLLGFHTEIKKISSFEKCEENNLKIFKCNEFFDKIIKKDSLGFEKSYIMYKNPDNLFYINKIHEFHKNAKIIVIYRDGRDTALSLLRRNFRRSFKECLSYWLEKYKLIKTKLDSNHVYILKYEDFVENTEYNLSKICSFLNIKNEALLILKKYKEFCHKKNIIKPNDEINSHLQLRKYQMTQNIVNNSRYKTDLTVEQKNIYNNMTKDINYLIEEFDN